MTFANITYERRDRIALITLNRPDRLNAIDGDTSVELREAFSSLRDDPDQWVAILTGTGEKSFSAGADLVAMARSMAEGRGVGLSVPFAGITRDFECWQPVIPPLNTYSL